MTVTPAQSTQPADQKAHTNRLIVETSPYLLQHAHNPVNWWAWGEEAFKAAREQDKPIFLSIGYSTCYWCHVMERESFENEEIAAVMNEHFICIKVDREERPDVDDIYMAAVQALTGQGGWPMSVFLEPQSLKPFIAGTYFPPEDAFGRPGFKSVLLQMSDAWKNRRAAVLKQADDVAETVREQLSLASEPKPLNAKHVEKAIAALLAVYDRKDGGFTSHPSQRAPKFPTPVNLDFLIGAAWDMKPVRDAVLHTLDRMAMGGMYDQVGGGFHRYSVDEKWLVPHFEKMLYDNGQLASTYARACELTNDPYYAEIVRETLEYVLREMTDSAGGFWSAQDAEVNAQEGGNYLWVESEIREALTAAGLKDDIDFALTVYGFKNGTNFQDPHHPELPPKNVVYLTDKPGNLASQASMSVDDFNVRLARVNAALLKVRDQREQPGTDDKILAGWNGLMIAGFADGGRVLKEQKYISAAKRAADFVLRNMRGPDGGLLRSYRGGQAKIDAFLEDYALMIHGLIALHRATGEPRLMVELTSLADETRRRFWDDASQGGGYFDTLEGRSDLFIRTKSAYDGAVPCGNTIMVLNLLALHEMTGNQKYLDDAATTLQSLSSVVNDRPTSPILAVLALKMFVDKHPDRLGQASTASAKPAAPTAAGSGKPVQFSTSTNEVTVTKAAPASMEVTLAIAKGYHVNAHQPGPDFLVPLRIELTGVEGLKVVVEYPSGEEYRGELADDVMRVHNGSVKIPLRIEQTGKVTGRPQLVLQYQACTDKVCLEPKTETLPLRIVFER